MTKLDGRKQRNNQPTNGGAAAVAAWRWRGGNGSEVAAHSATTAARWQQRGGCGSAKAQRLWHRESATAEAEKATAALVAAGAMTAMSDNDDNEDDGYDDDG